MSKFIASVSKRNPLKLALGLGVTCWLSACLSLCHAQNTPKYPLKPIAIICPFAAGGSADIMARFVAQHLSQALDSPVVVENRIGAGGGVGANYVAKAKPDGYNLLLITGGYPAQAALSKNPPFDPVKDISMISTITFYPFIVHVLATSPYKNLNDLIVAAKMNSSKMNYASSGFGSIHHLSSELLNVMAGTEIVHIPTKGGSSAMTELMGERVDLLIEAPTLSLPFIKSGKIRALAVTSKERLKALPDVPTVSESLPGYEVKSFIGVGTTAGTPAEIIKRLNFEIRKIIDDKEHHKTLADLGGDPQSSTPEEMQALVDNEYQKWQRVIELRKIERQ
jgi:tripartite-type tricarboxylate transporter receptor subunit TctC